MYYGNNQDSYNHPSEQGFTVGNLAEYTSPAMAYSGQQQQYHPNVSPHVNYQDAASPSMAYVGQQDLANQYYNASPHLGYQDAYSQDQHSNVASVSGGAGAGVYAAAQQEGGVYHESKPNEHDTYPQEQQMYHEQQLYHEPNQQIYHNQTMYHDGNQQMYNDANTQIYHDPNNQAYYDQQGYYSPTQQAFHDSSQQMYHDPNYQEHYNQNQLAPNDPNAGYYQPMSSPQQQPHNIPGNMAHSQQGASK
ncbi:hypothetical protein G6F68_013372 [Rhizopus microsporus]|nr:hypothetical protein G6F68_013372 [Rhizopus microsporus]